MDTAELAAQQILEARGYIVLATFSESRVGDVVQVDWATTRHGFDPREHKFVIISETDRADFIEQQRLFKALANCEPYLNEDAMPRYFRAIAE